MANRVVTDQAAERITYSDPYIFYNQTIRRITNGDVIIDEYNANVAKRSFYTNSPDTLFAGARQGLTIWIGNPSPQPFTTFNITKPLNGLWNISDINNPVVFAPLGVQSLHRTDEPINNNSYGFSIDCLEYVAIVGENGIKKGMTEGWKPFMHGEFGFLFDRLLDPEVGGNKLSIGGDHLKGVEFIGLESVHGFARIRSEPTVADNLDPSRAIDYFKIKRCFLHTGETGEGIYVGSTKSPPFALFGNVEIEDVVCLRSGAEGFQLQHTIAGAKRGYIKNSVIHSSAADWKNPFQAFQSSGMQLMVDEGDFIVRDTIIDGAGNNLLSMQGEDQGNPDGIKKIRFENVLWLNGRRRSVYFNDVNNAIPIEFNRNEFGLIDDSFQEAYPNTAISNEHLDVANDINLILKNCKYHNGKNFYGGNFSNNVKEIQNTSVTSITPPDYKLPLVSIAKKYEIWHEEYSAIYSDLPANTKIPFEADDVVFNYADKRFYLCLNNHTSSATTRPDLDATNWFLLSWDKSSGLRSDEVGYNTNNPQSIYPPDDMRLSAGSEHELLGRGISQNETNYTTYQWQWSENSGGVSDGNWNNIFDIEGRKVDFKPTIENRFYRCKINQKLANGSIKKYITDAQLFNITTPLSQATHTKDLSTFGLDAWVYKPEGFDQASIDTYPVLVFLHGSGAKGAGIDNMLTIDAPTPTSEAENKLGTADFNHNFIIISFYKDGGGDWTFGVLRDIVDEITANKDVIKADPSKIAITGLSLGGIGISQWIQDAPVNNRYRPIIAAFPVAGGSMSGNDDSQAAVDRNIFIKGWQGANDPSSFANPRMEDDRDDMNLIQPNYYELFTIPSGTHSASTWGKVYNRQDANAVSFDIYNYMNTL